MREILFRGQTRRYGEKVRMGDGMKLPSRWVYGGVLQGIGDFSIIYGGENMDDPSEGLEKFCVYTDTLGQYTGLTANGKKIFEGDILSGYFSAGVCVNGLVEFKDGSFGISWKWGDGRQFAAFTSITHSVEFEVIGNCHDNPELLEVSHE